MEKKKKFEIHFKRCNHWDIYREEEPIQVEVVEGFTKEHAIQELANKKSPMSIIVQKVVE